MAKEYYCLVSGLRELSLEGEMKGFDAAAIKSDILEDLDAQDKAYAELLYTFFDIENILNLKANRTKLISTGNISAEELEEQIKHPTLLPAALNEVLAAYTYIDNPDYEDIDKSEALQRALYGKYYEMCSASGCSFLEKWAEFDMNMRNIIAAVTARKAGRAIADVIIGDNIITEALTRSSATDFGLKSEIAYIDTLTAGDDNVNILERENKIDRIRWAASDEIATFDYFNVNAVLSYLVKVNIVSRWSRMDSRRGIALFKEFIEKLSETEIKDKE